MPDPVYWRLGHGNRPRSLGLGLAEPFRPKLVGKAYFPSDGYMGTKHAQLALYGEVGEELFEHESNETTTWK